MKRIIIRAKYPRDLTVKELDILAEDLRSAFPEDQVNIDDSPDENRVMAQLPEIVKIVLPAAGGALVKTVLDIAVAWAKRRFSIKKHKRPKTITIVGPSGKVLSQVSIADPISEPLITSHSDTD